MQEKDSASGEYIFALDIGTRSVIGIVGKREQDLFNVLDMEKIEHTTRAMYDGQIENIGEVARVARQVRSALEERLGLTLDRVSVAAAGRTLQTGRSAFELELNPDLPVDQELLYRLEMGAIDAAQAVIDHTQAAEEIQFICVGYSVLRYFLDEYPMSTILGHKGHRAGVEVIATFLPAQVVDSLKAAMVQAGLQIAHMTLEPIAAMNAVIPTELRLLNLALVDIGAGTSDIALSQKGSVAAYTMATIAGDEITEAIMRHYLVDFHTAEQMKLSLSQKTDTVSYTDVLGFEYSVDAQQLLDVIRPGVEQLAAVISEKILACNETAPAAVFLVGGGSKVSSLCEAVASALNIDGKKVAVGGNNYIKKQTSTLLDLSDPEFATPLGIALTAASSSQTHSFFVYVNEKKVQMLQQSQRTVMNALLLCGYKYSDLMGKSGKSITYQLNGERKVARGEPPQPAQITLNGQAASLATPLQRGDRLVIIPSRSGGDAQIFVKDLLRYPQGRRVLCDGKEYLLLPHITINGQPVGSEREIAQNDALILQEDATLAALLLLAGKDAAALTVLVNGKQAGPRVLLQDGDIVTTQPKQPAASVAGERSYPGELTVTLNGHEVQLPPKPEGTPYLFLDMLNFVDIDPTKPQGDILLRLNGRGASYLDLLQKGDTIEISWIGR